MPKENDELDTPELDDEFEAGGEGQDDLPEEIEEEEGDPDPDGDGEGEEGEGEEEDELDLGPDPAKGKGKDENFRAMRERQRLQDLEIAELKGRLAGVGTPASQAAPEVDLSALSPEERAAEINRLNAERALQTAQQTALFVRQQDARREAEEVFKANPQYERFRAKVKETCTAEHKAGRFVHPLDVLKYEIGEAVLANRGTAAKKQAGAGKQRISANQPKAKPPARTDGGRGGNRGKSFEDIHGDTPI